MLATPGAQHAGAESLPGPRAVEGVVPAEVGLGCARRAAAASAAGDDIADRAQPHPEIVRGEVREAHSLRVLRLGDHRDRLRVARPRITAGSARVARSVDGRYPTGVAPSV